MADKRKNIYNQISKELDIGTFEEFNSAMDNRERSLKFYSQVSKHIDLGAWNDFEQAVTNKQPEKEFNVLKDALKNSSAFGKIASAMEESGKKLSILLEAPKQFLDEGMSQISEGNAPAGAINIINSIGALGGSALGIADNFLKELPGGQTVSDAVNFTFSLPHQGAVGLTKGMEALGYPTVEEEKKILSTGGSILSGHKFTPDQVGETIDAFKNTVDMGNQWLLGALMGGGIKKTIPKETFEPIKVSEKRANELKKEVGKEKKVEPKPIEQVKDVTPEAVTEGKVTKVASDINKKLTEQGFNELVPEESSRYSPITKAEQIEKSSSLLENDYTKARNIAIGKEKSPNDINPQVIFNAVKNKAIKEKDGQTLKELALSDVGKQRSEAAQTLGASGFNSGELGNLDPVKVIQDVVKTREESPRGKRNTIIEKGYEEKIKTLEQKISEQEKRLTDIEAGKTYKKIQREESAKIRREKREISKEALDKEFGDIMGEFVKSYKPNVGIDPVQVKILMKAVRNKAQKGITDVAQVIDDIYLALADKIDGLTKRDIQDAISGYGKATFKTRDELQKSVADLKKQAEIISKIEDLEGGQLPIKRQTTKTTPTKELQVLKDELKTKMADSEIVAQESLTKTKETIKGKIKELENKIAQGDYKTPEAKEKLIDAEKISLEKELSDLRGRYRDVQKLLGDKITNEEVKIISELSEATSKTKEKMDSSPRRKLGEAPTPEELAYGRARVAYAEYVDGLKESATKMTWEEFKKSPMMNFIKGLGHVPGMTKSLKATFDNSGLFNQNIRVLFTHPTIWYKNGLKSFQDIWNTLGGKNVMAEVNADKVSRPNYELYKKEKLAIGTVEEQFPDSKLLEKIPYLGRVHKAANNAFTAMAYRNRMDVFDLLVEHSKNINADYTGIGKVVNSLTGRGSLGKFEGGADILNVTMFSPRLLKSHIDVLTAHVMSKDLSPFARKEALKNLLKIIGGISAVTTAVNAVKPGTIEIDPRSTDFLRVKIGDTKFNYTGGLGSVITLGSRLAPLLAGVEGKTKNAKGELVELNSGKFGSRTGFDVLVDFMQGKTSPLLGTILSRLEGQTFSGDRLTLGNQLTNLAMPLPVQNLIETAQNPQSADIVFTTIADALGIFATTYSNDENLRKFKNALLTADKEVFGIKKKENLHKALNMALFKRVITKKQYINYKQQLKDLQREALNNRSKK